MSKVYTESIYRWNGTKYVLVSETGYEYNGPVALADRAAQKAFGKSAEQAGSEASTLGSEGQAAGATLAPFYRREMGAQHLFGPGQFQEMYSAAEAPLAASAATTAGRAESERARTRNSAGFSAGLDQAARERNAALGQAGLDVGKADVLGAKDLNQEGARGLEGLYGIDTDAMLKAMGLQQSALQGQVEAGKSGWFQNMTNYLKAVGQATGGAAALFGG